MNHKKNIFQIFAVSILTIIIYNFYHIEFIRGNVEDFSFDVVNKFILSTKEERVEASNLLLFKVDDYYLKEKKLLDANKETTYGYLFPRRYLAQFIEKVDALLEDIEKENFPKALFIDYDMSYMSDPNNEVLSLDDKALIEALKKDRPYKIYLPKTANHNFIQNLDNEIIQKKIKERKIVFVSVGLTISADDVSRRYYPYETYSKVDYPLVEIEIFKEFKGEDEDILKKFSQKRMSLIENRIIFKEYKEKEIIEQSEFIQSFWDNLKLFSANYPLDYVPEEDFKDSVLYLGGTHSKSDDVFVKDTFDKELSGIEMHANALMTMFYFDGKLNRLNIFYAISLIAFVAFFTEFLIQVLTKNLEESKFIKKVRDSGYIFLTFFILFMISYYLLTEQKVWFNWFIPSLMSTAIPLMTSVFRFFISGGIKRFLQNLFFIFTFTWLINLIKNKRGET